MILKPKEEIAARRLELEHAIDEILTETESPFKLEDVQSAILNETGPADMATVLAMFDRGGGAWEMADIQGLVAEAWDYFPHASLGGVSPAEARLKIA